MRLDTSYCDSEIQGAQKGARLCSGASAVHFGEIFPNLVGVGHLIGPEIQTWALFDSLSWKFYKIKIVVNVPYSA